MPQPEVSRSSGVSAIVPAGELASTVSYSDKDRHRHAFIQEETEAGGGRPMIRALLFDTYGTVVDWRASILAELRTPGEAPPLSPPLERLPGRGDGRHSPGLGEGNGGQVAVDAGGRDLPPQARRARRQVRDDGADGGRPRHPESCVVAFAPLARLGGGPGAPEDTIRHLTAVERELCRDGPSR